LAWLAAYLAVLAAAVAAAIVARQVTLREYGTPEARAEWQAWSHAEHDRSSTGPVRRTLPTAEEPPALLMMRDRFVVVLVAAVVFSSLFFAIFAVAVRGVFSGNVPPGD
jgi:hypothetical protein